MEPTSTDVRYFERNGLKVAEYKELVLPRYFLTNYPNESVTEKLEEIKSTPYNNGDLLICCCQKAGSHWFATLIQFLKYEGPIENASSYPVVHIDVEPRGNSWVFVSHLRLERLPNDFIERGKVVLLIRNPKDVAVSLFHFMRRHPKIRNQQSWESFIECFLHGPVMMFEPYSDYLCSLDFHIVYFEDLKRNGVQELRNLQKFLWFQHCDDQLQAILARCSIEKMKSDVNSGRVRTILLDENGRSFPYRKGDVGDWKNHFTVAQSEAFDAIWKSKMGNSMFKFQYT